MVSEPEALFYKGSKVLTQSIIHFKQLSKKLENDQFNYNVILDKSSSPELKVLSTKLYFVLGLILGLLLSLVIVFLKNILKKKL